MEAVPKFTASAAAGDRLFAIPGIVPDPSEPMSGCRFAPRCPFAAEICFSERPADQDAGGGHRVYCHRWKETAEPIGAAGGKEAGK